MSSLSTFFKDTFFYGLASIFPRLINFALVPIYTQVFNTVEFSAQTKWYIYAAFINIVLTFGMETAFFKFYTSEKQAEKVVSTSMFLLLVTSSIFLLIGFIFSTPLTHFFDFPKPIFLQLLIWTTVFDTLAVIPLANLRVLGKSKEYFIIRLVNVFILVAVTVILLLVVPYFLKSNGSMFGFLGIEKDYKAEVVHIFVANVVASFMVLVFLIPSLFKTKFVIDLVLLKKMYRYAWPIMVGGLAFIINENLDKLLMATFLGDHINGVYAACYKLGVFMTLFVTAFRLGAEPFFFKVAHTDDAKNKYSLIMTWFVILGCLFTLIIVAFIDFIAGIFLRQASYHQGLMIVPVILMANLFSGMYNNLSIWYKLNNMTRFGMLISIIGAILTVINLCVFIPTFKIMGGALATFLTYFIMTTISWYLGQKYYPIAYELKKILVVIGVTCGLCALSFLVLRGQLFYNMLLVSIFLLWILYIGKDVVSKILSKQIK